MIDVLIIGSGPHALTLSTLLCGLSPSPLTGQDAAMSPPSSETPKLHKAPGRSRRRSRTSTAAAGVELPAPTQASLAPGCRLSVVDSYGRWAALWEGQFAALNIPHLRSHALVHTDPFHKTALQDFAVESGRSSELHSLPDKVYILDENAYFNDMRLGKKEKRRLNVSSTLKNNPSFGLPSTKLSVDFFQNQVTV
ncbi:unnamed protein product [Knipowitschia caucasica]